MLSQRNLLTWKAVALLLAVAVFFLSARLARAMDSGVLDEDWIFGERLLPCQYRSPPDPACPMVRHCRKEGRRWVCSRWHRRNASSPAGLPRNARARTPFRTRAGR